MYMLNLIEMLKLKALFDRSEDNYEVILPYDCEMRCLTLSKYDSLYQKSFE